MANSRENTTIEEKSNEGPDHLSDLPDDLLKYSIFRHLPSSALAQLGKTNQRFANFPECEEAKRALERLLFFVAHGQKDQAEALIAEDPDLLLFEGEVQDYSGRKLQGTALGMALGAEDVNLYANDGTLLGEGMVEMIHRHLKRLPDGEAEIARQTLRQFPEGWEEQEEKRHEGDLQALRKVRNAIECFSSYEECKAAILEFKKHVTPPKEAITTGKHWNARLLQAAFEMGCNEFFHDPGKNNLFYEEVIGYLQSLAPASDAMAQAQGLKNLLETGENFRRDLKYRDGAGHYYPLSSAGPRLGSGLWVDSYLGVAIRSEIWRGWLKSSVVFKTLLEQKQRHCRQFMPQPDSHRSERQISPCPRT